MLQPACAGDGGGGSAAEPGPWVGLRPRALRARHPVRRRNPHPRRPGDTGWTTIRSRTRTEGRGRGSPPRTGSGARGPPERRLW